MGQLTTAVALLLCFVQPAATQQEPLQFVRLQVVVATPAWTRNSSTLFTAGSAAQRLFETKVQVCITFPPPHQPSAGRTRPANLTWRCVCWSLPRQHDVRAALEQRPAGAVDVRNVTLARVRPRGRDDISGNVTTAAADVEVVWSNDGGAYAKAAPPAQIWCGSNMEVGLRNCRHIVVALDVQDAIMVHYMPNGTTVPSECGITMVRRVLLHHWGPLSSSL
jgi:hypothetical protein